MKNSVQFFSFLLVLFLSFSNLTAQNAAFASYSNNDFVPSLMIDYVIDQMEDAGYSLSSDDYFTLVEGDSKFKSRTLYSGVDYVFINVPTESGFNDSDIFLKTTNGTLLKSDSDSQPVSVVEWSASTTRDVKIWVRNYNSNRRNYGYDSRLLIFYKN